MNNDGYEKDAACENTWSKSSFDMEEEKQEEKRYFRQPCLNRRQS